MSSPPGARHLWLVANGKHAGLPELRRGVEDLRRHDYRVDVRVTWEAGDAERYVRDGREAGADMSAAGVRSPGSGPAVGQRCVADWNPIPRYPPRAARR